MAGRRIRAAAVVLVVLLSGAVTARLFVWPQLPPLPSHVDAIIKLGGPGDRHRVALALARVHTAPVLVESTTPEYATSNRCFPPVPGVLILCFHPEPTTTRGEAEYIGWLARRYHWKSIILVTTRDQAWRARLRVGRCFDGDVYVRTAHLPPLLWVRQIPYQWAATAKALTVERSC